MCQKAYHASTEVMTQNQSLSYRTSSRRTPSTNLVNSLISISFPRGLCASSKLPGNVGLDDRHAVHLLLSFLLRLQLLMLPEVLDVFGVRQVFLSCVLVVVFLPVVNLVFVLIVTVVSRTVAKVGQREAFGDTNGVLCVRDGAAAVCVEELEHLVHGVLFLLRWDVLSGLILEAVGLEDVVARPLVAAVVVVEIEERASVERIDVVLLWNVVSPLILRPLRLILLTSHMPGRPVCIWRHGLLIVTTVRLDAGDKAQCQDT